METMTIPGQPRPKKRPRVTRSGGVYSESDAHERMIATYLLPWRGRYPSGDVILETRFAVNGRSKADPDNLGKLVADAAEKAGVYTNDRQVLTHVCHRQVVPAGQEATMIRIGRPEEFPEYVHLLLRG